MWVEFVVGSILCSKRFFSGTPVFPSPQKTAFPNSNSTRNQVHGEPQSLRECATSKSLFIYIILYGCLFMRWIVIQPVDRAIQLPNNLANSRATQNKIKTDQRYDSSF